MTQQKQFIKNFSRALGVWLLIGVLIAGVARAAVHTGYDPYADGVNNQAGTVLNPNNSLGAPNQNYATLMGSNPSLTLDMGQYEEGLQDLKLYVGMMSVQMTVSVQFLSANLAAIKSESQQLNVGLNDSAATFAYDWHDFGQAYRYVRISVPVAMTFRVDAIEATGYLGASDTQDTDGYGHSDRAEQDAGTDPLIAEKVTTPPATT